MRRTNKAQESQQDEKSLQVDYQLGQVLNICKPVGWTSFDIVRWVRSRLGKIKVGHAGTLDPFAMGVMLVCIGPATKRVPELMALEKEYEGCIELGIYTDTLDVTGRVMQKKPVPVLDVTTVENAASAFIGEIEQTPPMYSAIKVDGKRLYKIARAGGHAPRKIRVVNIFSIEVLGIELPLIFFRVRCSKGTYVRTLAADWAEHLGTVGFLKTLTRTRVGSFTLDTAYQLNYLEKYQPPGISFKNRPSSEWK